MEPTVARVNLLDVPCQLDKPFDYYIPEDIRDEICIGCFVTVPFGGGNRRQTALVTALSADSEFSELKPILHRNSRLLTLSPEMLKLCTFLKDYTFCTTGEAVRTILPSSALAKLTEYYCAAEPNADIPEGLTQKQQIVYQFIRTTRRPTDQKLAAQFGEAVKGILRLLLQKGLILREAAISEPKGQISETVSLAVSEEEAEKLLLEGTLRGKNQIGLLRVLMDEGELSADDCRDRLKISRTQLKALQERGILRIRAFDSFRSAPEENIPLREYGENTLSAAQEEVFQTLCGLIDSGEPKAALLHGVTGSGKTRVMKAVIDHVLAAGKSVIVLVPEISLTPQTVGFFRYYYRDKIAVLHSMLSAGERFDAWRRIRDGAVSVCIGTRSAVFAPFSNLGAIIIDEEQEHTYKSDMNPKYHARDIARFRCAYHHALMLLASATPSVESYYKAKQGIYTLIRLTERFGKAALPSVRIVDLREDTQAGKVSPLGSVLEKELAVRLERKEQSILFINRRGYHHFLSCPLCGKVLTCPHCSVSLTHHAVKQADSHLGGMLFCHYCGYREPVPTACPECGSRTLQYVGFGTQRVEEDLQKRFPQAKIMRMDADTTASKFAYQELLERFRAGEADILLGTQMVTKGHDFPGVTLVGVLSADASLYLDDYRANERTFDLITQVVGRAGRADKPGEALIQTYNPSHPLLQLARMQDYEEFWREDSALRRALVFPPYCDLIAVTLTSGSENELLHAAAAFDSRMRALLESTFSDVRAQIFGPMEAPVYKINELYRLRFIVKCRAVARTRLLFRQLLSEFSAQMGKKITFSADINPNTV